MLSTSDQPGRNLAHDQQDYKPAGDLRLELRFRNAALLRVIEKRFDYLRDTAYKHNQGLLTRAATLIGVDAQWLRDVAGLRKSPYLRSGLSGNAKLVCSALEAEAADIFPPALYSKRFPRVLIRDVDSARMISLGEVPRNLLMVPANQEDGLIERERLAALNLALSALSPREEEIIRQRFGLGCSEEMTLQEIGNHFSVSKDRIRQIEARALRKLRYPSISNRLR